MPDDPSPHRADAAVLAAIVGHHPAFVWRYLRSLGAPATLADELTADTFVVCWQRGIEDRGDAAVATFLRRTAQNLFLKHCRDQGRRDELLVELADRMWLRDCDEDAGDAVLQALRACTQALEAHVRKALQMCYGDNAARGDRDRIATTLGMKPNGLKTLLQRARIRLRQCMETKLGDEQ